MELTVVMLVLYAVGLQLNAAMSDGVKKNPAPSRENL